MADKRADKLVDGNLLDRYRIVSKIGAGGMGEVYLAQDTKLDRRVALKILPPEFAEDEDRMSRFVREAKSASALNHPNIITIHEIGESGGTHFIATEFIEGETLRERLRKAGFSVEECLEVSVQIASALQAAHAVNIVHRDIKPENMMLRPDGLVKILDFGIAKLTEKKAESIDEEAPTARQSQTALGMIIGTAAYMSPEQAQGRAVDARSDIFSFGVVLYEMLSGHTPFAGETALDAIGRILHKEPTPLNQLVPGLPAELKRIIDKALCKDSAERYQSVKELLADLKELKEELNFQSKLKRNSQTNGKEAEAPTQIIKAANTAEEDPQSAIPNLKSVAVLPFSNMSADAENEYFCDGLAEELLNALAKIEDLKVAARTSAFSFKGKNTNVGEIGEKLGVKNVLEGSVRRSGNKLRITVQLVNAANGFHIWSERYDREMQDIFDVQDEITLAVVDALKVKLFGDEKEAVMKRYTSNPEAYQLYLRGRFFFFKRTPEGFWKAIEYFEQAVEIDDRYALAYSGLADCYTFLGFYEEMPPAEAEKNLKPLADKASALDDTLAETCVSLALRKTLYDWNFRGGSAEFKKAVALNPKYTFAHHLDGATLVLLGLYDEAVAAEKRAVELEPFTAIFNATLGWWLYLSRRTDEAILQALKTIEIAPNHFFAYWVLGLAYGRTGRFPEAIASLEKSLSLTGGDQHIKGELGRIYALSGQREEALKLLSEFAEAARQKYVSPANLAKVYSGLGEREKMYQQLEKAVEERAVRLPWFLIDPALDDYRAEPRFQDILRRVGLPAGETRQTDESLEAKTVMLSSSELKTGQPDEAETQSASAEPNPKQTNNPQSEIQNPKSKWWLLGLLGLILIVGGFFGYRYFTANKQIESIAVMPFVNESGNQDIEYLSDGMTETLIGSLSQVPNLNVKARSSVFRYKGKETGAQTIGKELNVQAILTGRVVQRGQDLILYLELIDAQTENVLWKESYNKPMSNLVSLQSEIARDVSTSLKTKLSGADKAKMANTGTTNSEAYQTYLKGRYFFSKGRDDNMEQSLRYFQEAVKLDPQFARGYAGIADVYTLRGTVFGSTVPPSEVMPKARAAAEKAIELDPNLSEAYTSLAWVKFRFDWDWAGAENDFKKAVELNPSNAQAHQWYGEFLSCMRREEEAVAEMKKARELEPFSLIMNYNLASIYFGYRRYDEAIAEAKNVLEMDKSYPRNYRILKTAYMRKGMEAEAFDAALKERELQNDSPERIALYKEVFKTRGLKAALAKMAELELQEDKKNVLPPIYKAYLYLNLDDREKALDALEETYKARAGALVALQSLIEFDPLRDEPRFQEIVRKMNFPK